MKHASLTLAILFVSTFLAACAGLHGSESDGPSAERHGLLGTSWTCTAIGGRSVEGPELTLIVDERGGGSGHGGVNRWFTSDVTDDAGSLEGVSFLHIGTTRMAGPPADMDQERRFLEALGRSSSFRRNGDRLELLDGETVTLKLVARS